MQVEPYSDALHLEEMIRWNTRRSLPAPIAAKRPEIGLVVPGLAIGFVVQTDTTFAMVEGLITNPESDKALRAKAIRLLVLSLCAAAKDRGYSDVWAVTARPEVRDLAGPLGLRVGDELHWTIFKRL